MSETNPKVALLGRPGPAREHLRNALASLGGQITIEGEPGELAPAQVAATGPSVVVVSLDAAMEDQLDEWDELFDTEGLNVIYDEAATTSQLDGWDLARWARHLAAKILGHDRTLPPAPEGAEAVHGAVDWIPSPGGPISPAVQMDAERLEDYAVEAVDHAGSVPVADDPRTGADDAPGELSWSNDLTAIEAEELELDDEVAALMAQHDAHAGQDGILRFDEFTVADGEDGSDGLDLDIDIDTGSAQGDEQPREAEGEPEVAAVIEGIGEAGSTAASGDEQADEEQAADGPRLSFGRELSLVMDDADDDVQAADSRGAPAPASAAAATMSFDELAAAFELEDVGSEEGEETPAAVAPVGGLVVLLAGMGGPDALRQLLSALPKRIPVPIVVWQQLNAGTHDRLASQLSKTGKVETALAVIGEPPRAGRVYILPPGVGVDCSEGLQFVADPASPASLIKALAPLGDSATVVALSGTEGTWLADSESWLAQGGHLLAQSPATCFEASACESLVKQGVVDAAPADLAIRALSKWHEDF